LEKSLKFFTEDKGFEYVGKNDKMR